MTERDKWIKRELIKLEDALSEQSAIYEWSIFRYLDFGKAIQKTELKEIWNEKINE